MIPNKIYIPIIEEDGKKLLCANWWETDARSRYVNETIPYIRKDTLLEWAKQKQYESLTIVADNFWQEVIDKLNSL